MDRIKNKLEIILLYVTLIFSLAALKDELLKNTISLGYTRITAGDYFIFCVGGFSISIYLYVLEFVFAETNAGKWRIWNYLIKFGFILFVFILLSPLILILNYLFYITFGFLSKINAKKLNVIVITLNSIATIFTVFASYSTAKKAIAMRKRAQQELAEQQEIKELENATKLYESGFYSQSILESFKTLETHLVKELTRRDIRVGRSDFKFLVDEAVKFGLVDQNLLADINDLRKMRNVAAHLNQEHTKEQAQFAINTVTQLILKNNPQ